MLQQITIETLCDSSWFPSTSLRSLFGCLLFCSIFPFSGFHDRVRQFPHPPHSAAENVAYNQGFGDPAQIAVNGWIESPYDHASSSSYLYSFLISLCTVCSSLYPLRVFASLDCFLSVSVLFSTVSSSVSLAFDLLSLLFRCLSALCAWFHSCLILLCALSPPPPFRHHHHLPYFRLSFRGHRKNMLAHHTYCGIGVWQSAEGAYYFTQLFALF